METLTTMMTPAMLAGFKTGDLVGHLIVPEGIPKQRENYEVAAWFRDYEVIPGTYEVYFYRNPIRSIGDFLYAPVKGKVVAAYLGTLFGGVSIGPDTAGQRAIGEIGEYRMTCWLGYEGDTTRRIAFQHGCTFIPLES